MDGLRPDGSGAAALAPRRVAVGGAIAFLAIAAAGLTWAKWDPYLHKALAVAATHRLGASILTGARTTPPEPSLGAALDYALAYFQAIWTALVAGLLVAAGAESLVPRRWLLRAMAGRGPLDGLVAGLLAVPCMMCTCCSAPVAVSLRRSGVPAAPVLAWWVGNPAINPAVIVFAAFVLPWQWVALRLAAGVVLVLVVVTLVARPAGPGSVDAAQLKAALDDPGPLSVGDALARYGRSLARLSLTLLPEYLGIVLLLGAFRGWLFPVAHGLAGWGPLAVVLFAVAGTLFVIPTAGEIPIVQAMLKAGIGVGPPAALLVTLPAVSVPSLAMVWRSFPARVSVALAGSVAGVGLLTALAALLLIRG
jgi:uncharacterized membrane protein YraQ (UPF0718 family)